MVTAGKSLLAVLKSPDYSYQVNPRKAYPAVNQSGCAAELLAAPSTHPLPRFEPFVLMVTLVEQEWLLLGLPLNAVVVTVRHFLHDTHPLGIDFALASPEELRPHFNAWCESRHFVPQD